MREYETRQLVVIEENLRAEAPELVALFDPVAEPVAAGGGAALRWLAAVLLLLGLALRRPVRAPGVPACGSRPLGATSGTGSDWPGSPRPRSWDDEM
jgi:Protein of unknown function (DUF3040)